MSKIYSEYEMVIPDWLNIDYFEKILQASEKDSTIRLASLTITPASANNDHYGSLMYRAKLIYKSAKHTRSRISLVVKTMPEVESVKRDMLADTFIFRTEIRMYSETIPKMEAILRKYGDDTVLGARILYSSLEPHQIIIFEDLVEKGFATLENREPTNEEIKKAILKIAKWHAVSYKLAQEEPESITTYNDGTYNLDLEKIDFFVSGIKNFINGLLSTDDELKQYIPYFKELDKNILKRISDMCNAYKRGEKALFVLNHGDFHFKNMMFKRKDNGDLEDIMLIDFQCCYYGPAVADLIYSIYMLWDSDTRLNKRDEMIYYYFSNFIDSLKKYEFKGELPKMADLQIDFIKYRGFETFIMAALFPITLAFADQTIQLDKVVESAEERLKLLSAPALIAQIKRILPRYLQKGSVCASLRNKTRGEMKNLEGKKKVSSLKEIKQNRKSILQSQ